MGTTIAIVVLMVLLGMVLILFELLTPTFGPLAALGLAAFGVAVWQAFTISGTAGTIVLVATLMGLPVYVLVLVHYLPRLPMGNRLFLRQQAKSTAEGTPDATEMAALVGKIGTAETMLRPAGAIRIEGRRVNAQAESGIIEKGESVRVVAADMGNVIVRRQPPQQGG